MEYKVKLEFKHEGANELTKEIVNLIEDGVITTLDEAKEYLLKNVHKMFTMTTIETEGE